MEEDACGLLAAINAACDGAQWRIFDEDELADGLPRRDGASVSALLERLEARRLIEIRYAEGGTYCVRALPAGRAYMARIAEERAADRARERRLILRAFVGAFVGALAGAFFGSVLAALVSLLW